MTSEYLLSSIELLEEIKDNQNLRLTNRGGCCDGNRTIVIKTKGIAYCDKPLSDIVSDSIIEIFIDPRIQDNAEMTMTIFRPTAILSELKASYICEFKPYGKSYEDRRPQELVSWSLIRAGHFPGAEGGNSGAIIASKSSLYEADGVLNMEWRKMISTLPVNQRSKYISKQKKWLKLVEKRCNKKEYEDSNNQWDDWHQTSCRAVAYSQRAEQVKTVQECISTKKIDCPDLKDNP